MEVRRARPRPLPAPAHGLQTPPCPPCMCVLPLLTSSSPLPPPPGNDVPEYFLCPITGCLMRQPAMTPDGVTYDYDAIVEWLQQKQTDPSTNQPLSPEQVSTKLYWANPKPVQVYAMKQWDLQLCH